MYSVVLMAALTSGSASPEFCWHRNSCQSSCHGCYSSCSSCYGCHSSFYAGYTGWGSGCYSGGCYSCYSSYACSGWGHGCYSGYSGYSGYSCYGCYSGYSGYAGYGCYAGYSGYAGYPASYTCHGCYGCYGGHSGYGMPVYAGEAVISNSPAIVNPPAVNVPNTTAPVAPVVPNKETTPLPREKTSGDFDRARILVQVPDDAKLYIDGNLMRTGSANRVFQTPVLQTGKTYYYDLRVEVVRDGQTVVQEKQVLLRPGQEISTAFDMTNVPATAQNR